MPPRPPLYTLTTSRRQTVWDKGLAWLPLGAETCRRCRVHKSPLRDSAEHKSQMATLACGVQMHMQGPETPTTMEVRLAPNRNRSGEGSLFCSRETKMESSQTKRRKSIVARPAKA